MCNPDDIYARAVARVLGIPVEHVTPQQRTKAKLVCFSVMYRTRRFSSVRPAAEQLFDEACEALTLVKHTLTESTP